MDEFKAPVSASFSSYTFFDTISTASLSSLPFRVIVDFSFIYLFALRLTIKISYLLFREKEMVY